MFLLKDLNKDILLYYIYLTKKRYILYQQNTFFFKEYLQIWIYLIIVLILTSILIVLSYLCTPKHLDSEKLSAYECGFDSVDDAHKTFDVHFYIVGVLFLIFDLEVAFLFPWAVSLTTIDFFGFFIMLFFFSLVTLGFGYEWSKGALDWSSNKNV